MDFIQAILLGLIQGITEWLPISSSGHLVLAQQLFGLSNTVSFDAILHMATVLVILIVFWKDLLNMAKSLFKWRWDEHTKLLALIALASVPTAIIGLAFKDLFTSLFENLFILGICFILNGLILLATLYAKNRNKQLNATSAIVMGVAQGISIVPSISRSGITIATGLFMGIKKENLIKFSFLMAVPAIMGAFILEHSALAFDNIWVVLAGAAASLIAGYISLEYLIRIVEKGKFHYFAYYCIALGILILIFQMI